MTEDRRSIGRRESDLVLGELVGTVKEIKSDLGDMRAYIQDNRAKIDALHDDVSDKFKTAEVVFKTLKFIAYALAAVLTFKFGDIASIWRNLFN